MSSGKRNPPGGYVYHVLNRSNARKRIFHTTGDYQALLTIIAETLMMLPMRLLDYCLMPNHWHLVMWPEGDDQLAAFMHRMTTTHVRRFHCHRDTVGEGHIYQGPYKFFPIEEDDHYYAVCRYVERNALRANLVERAEHWRWGSLWQRSRPYQPNTPVLSPWPLPLNDGWTDYVNSPQTEAELQAIRESVRIGRPYGRLDWQLETASKLGIPDTVTSLGASNWC